MFIVRNLRALINVPISKLASLVRPCALWDVQAIRDMGMELDAGGRLEEKRWELGS